VGVTTLTFPEPSAEVFGNLQLRLDPGWYALVFGSGLFGATGRGAAVLNNPDIGDPSYIAFQPGPGFGWDNLSSLFRNFRFVVEGRVVPEPSASGFAFTVSLLLLVRRLGMRT
jgi:hypothetical protein